ncbi:MAG TPA: ABC transporter permease [Firmicutes bacterium]|nr:ABC transporter permease [Bacillota bacterium]
MKEILAVFRFTFKDNIRKRAFILTTLLVVALIVVACALPALTGGQEEDGGQGASGSGTVSKDLVCYLLDADGVIPGAKEALAAALPTVDFRDGEPAKLDEYKQTMLDDKSVSVLEIAPGEGGLPQVRLYTADFMSGLDASAVSETLRALFVSNALAQAGVSADITQIALSDLPVEQVSVGKMDLSGYVLGILLVVIMFFAVYYYGYGVAMSVASEKTSRVMETLVVSAKPSRILIGKCLGMGALGLCQLGLFLAVGAACFTLMVPADFTIGGMPLAISSFPLSAGLLVLLYFLLGYALFAMVNSVCGAMVSRAEDLNSAMMPAVLLSLVCFYAAYMVVLMPDSGMKRIVTYIPFTSPFIMPFRLLNETVPTGDILISLLLLVVAIVLVSLLSIRLYSASVLHYGSRLRLRDLFRLKA